MIRSESLKGKIKNIAKSKKLSSQEVLQNISGLNFFRYDRNYQDTI